MARQVSVRVSLLAAAGVLIVSLLPGVAAAAGATPTADPHAAAARAVRWGCLIGLGIDLAILFLGQLIGAKVSKLFVGTDNRISTSKTVAALWTLLVGAVLFGVVYANLLNHPQALAAMGDSGIVGQYAVLFGGPLGAAILAKQIVNTQSATNANAKQPAGSPTAKDLIANDAGDTDLGDFQYVLFNLVAFFFVISTLMHAPLNGLPHIPDVLLGLTSVSAAGYVGKKALTPTGTVTASIRTNPPQGAEGTEVKIEVKGLASGQTVLNALVQFGQTTDAGQIARHVAVANGVATLTVDSPLINAAVNEKIEVCVVTDDGMVLDAGTYTYT